MSRFANDREAKEFLVGRIVDEAEREGVSLSEVARKMLYFSETGWTLPDMAAVNDEFNARYDQQEFEEKIAGLIRNARKRAPEEAGEESAAWLDAIRVLEKGDHCLLVMIDRAGRVRPPFDLLKLFAAALAVVAAGVSLLFLARRLGIDSASLTFLVWAIAACAFISYGLACLLSGRKRAQVLADKLFGLSWRNK